MLLLLVTSIVMVLLDAVYGAFSLCAAALVSFCHHEFDCGTCSGCVLAILSSYYSVSSFSSVFRVSESQPYLTIHYNILYS